MHDVAALVAEKRSGLHLHLQSHLVRSCRDHLTRQGLLHKYTVQVLSHKGARGTQRARQHLGIQQNMVNVISLHSRCVRQAA